MLRGGAREVIVSARQGPLGVAATLMLVVAMPVLAGSRWTVENGWAMRDGEKFFAVGVMNPSNYIFNTMSETEELAPWHWAHDYLKNNPANFGGSPTER